MGMATFGRLDRPVTVSRRVQRRISIEVHPIQESLVTRLAIRAPLRYADDSDSDRDLLTPSDELHRPLCTHLIHLFVWVLSLVIIHVIVLPVHVSLVSPSRSVVLDERSPGSLKMQMRTMRSNISDTGCWFYCATSSSVLHTIPWLNFVQELFAVLICDVLFLHCFRI